MSINSVKNDSIGQDSVVNAQKPIAPTITNYSVDGVDDEALDPAGGQTVLINGSGFQRGATVTFDGSAIAVVSWVSSSQLSFTAPAKSAGTYNIYVVNSDGGTAIYIPGIIYSTFPTWTTAQGTLGSYYETQSISKSVVATGDAPITYSLVSGSLPSGATLASDGTITGTSPAESGSTTYSFTVQADDAELQSSTRSFSLTINTDVVTWVTPSSGSTITLDGTAYSQALSATDAAGYSVSYSANALPTGLTLSSGTISGTPTTEGTSSTLLTATAATTNRTGTNTITWVVSLSDAYWKYATLLLTANSSIQTSSFVSDNSINNAQLTVFGDTKVSNFNPYQNGYYSYTFDGNGDGISTAASAAFNINNGDWTWEGWIYPTSLSNSNTLISVGTGGSNMRYVIGVAQQNGNFYFGTGNGSWAWSSQVSSNSGAFVANKWQHFAVVRYNSVVYYYVNGISAGSSSGVDFGSAVTGTVYIGSYFNNYNNDGSWFNGFVSNIRFVKGTAVYTSSFTPSTSPLTAISGTSILTCRSNRVVDISSAPVSITITGDLSVSTYNPFVLTTPITTYGSAYFDGTGDFITAPATVTNSLSGTWTVEAWCYMTVAPTGNTYATSFPILTSEDNAGSIFHYWGIGSTAFVMMTRDGTTSYQTITGNMPGTKQWFHVAVTNVGTTVKVFINGAQVGSLTQAAGTWNANGILTRIGALYTYRYATGYISDLRVVNGTEVYTSAFTPPTSQLTAVSGTQLLTLQSNSSHNNSVFKDNSYVSNLITRNGNATNGTFSPYGDNWSNYFSGASTDYLTLTLAASPGTTLTFEAWVYPNALTTNHRIFGGTLDLYVDTSGTLGMNGGGLYTGTGVIVKNTWQHVAVVINSGVATVYVNGVSKTLSGTNSGLNITGTTNYIGQYSGGGGYTWNGYISNLRLVKGKVVYTGNFTVPTAPLTQIQNSGTNITAITGSDTVQLLTCQSNRVIDNSTSMNTFTINGTVSTTRFSPFSTVTVPKYYSTYFNGSTDYLTVPASSSLDLSSGDYTFDFSFYSTAFAGMDSKIGLLSATISSSNDNCNALASSFWFFGHVWSTGISFSLNTWYQISVVKSGTLTTLYVDGVSKGTKTGSPSGLNGTNVLSIGKATLNDTTYLSGYISNLRIVKGTAIIPPAGGYTAPLTAVANTRLLTCQNNTFVDNSTNNFTITAATTTVKPLLVSPFAPTASKPTDYSTAVFGGSMYFDGTNDYVNTTTTVTPFGANDFTIEMWFYTAARTQNYPQLFSNSNTWTGNVFQIFEGRTDVSGKISLWVYNINTVSPILTSNTTIRLNTWYHVAITRSGTSVRLFINGVLDVPVATTSASFDGGNASTLYVGGSAATSYYNGYISDFRILTSALYTSNFYPSATPATPVITGPYSALTTTTTSISSLLLSGTSGGVIDATRTIDLETVADAKVTNFSPYNGSYYSYNFPSSAAYIAFAGNTSCAMGSGDFTIEFWFYADGSISGIPLVDFRPSGTATGLYPTIYIPGTLAITYYTNGADRITGATLTTGTWYHIALTRASGNTKLFLNGSQTGSTYSDSNVYLNGTSRPVLGAFGDTLATSLYITGKISNFRIVKGTAVYTSNFTPSTSPLTAISGTSLLTCQSNKFVDNSTNNFTITRSGDTKVATQNPFQVNTGQSYYFDGTGDYLWSPATTRFVDFGNGDWSIECWVYFNSVGNAAHVWQFGANSTARSNLYLSSSKLTIYSIGTTVLTGSTTLVAGQWYHVAATFSASTTTTKLFVNGSQDGINTTYNSYPKNAGDIAFMIGYQPYSGGAGDYLNGYITDLRITKGYARTITVPTTPYKLN